MDQHTTFRIGGPADRFAIPSGIRDFQSLLQESVPEEPITVVGWGSNLLVSDRGIRGLVVHTEGLRWIRIQENKASVGAGVLLPRLLRGLARRGFGGMESLFGIPGSVGGAIRMNAGTVDGCMADHLLSLTLLHRSGRVERKEREEIDFGYRRMELPPECWIVGARVRLKPMETKKIERQLREKMEERKKKQPLGLPSAGSIFKNPPGDFAGRLIEAVGMKGAQVGDAQVSKIHANFIVNRGKARAADVLTLIREIKSQVAERFGISLELEIRIVGEPDPAGEEKSEHPKSSRKE